MIAVDTKGSEPSAFASHQPVFCSTLSCFDVSRHIEKDDLHNATY